MNLILLDKSDFRDNNKAVLSGRRMEHIVNVLKSAVGDSLKVGLIDGKIGKAVISSMNETEIIMDVHLHRNPPSPLPVTLIVGLPRPKSLKKVVQCASSMGVKKIYFIETWKVDKSYWDSPVLKADSLREHIFLGLEQGGDTVMPGIEFRRRFKPFIEDELPDIASGSIALIADPSGEENCPSDINTQVTLAIGPEGGFTEYELEKLREIGFEAVNIGGRILRVEYAVAALVGRLGTFGTAEPQST